MFLPAHVWVFPQQTAPKGPKDHITKTDFTTVWRAKHGRLWPLSSLCITYLDGVFRHQITSLLFYQHGFIVNGCRFTCQTMPPLTICNLLAFTSPTWLQRFRFKLSTKQKFLDCLFALDFNGFHTPFLIYQDKYYLFATNWDVCGQANHWKDNIFMFLSD